MSFSLRVDDDLELRLIEPEHAEALFEVIDANREHVGRRMPWVEFTHTAEDTRTFSKQALRDFAERKQLQLCILERGRIVGATGWIDWKQGVQESVANGSADIGYWLIAEATGRGIVTRCVKQLLDLAFDTYGMFRITIRCEPDNERSAGVPRRLGFTHEGTMRHVCKWNGRWVDHELYAMLADDWKTRR